MTVSCDLTCKPWWTMADEASCLFIAEIGRSQFRKLHVVFDVRALETLTTIATGMLVTLIDIYLTVLSLVT